MFFRLLVFIYIVKYLANLRQWKWCYKSGLLLFAFATNLLISVKKISRSHKELPHNQTTPIKVVFSLSKSTSHHDKTMVDLSEPKNIWKRIESALIIEKKPQNRHASGLSPKRPLKVWLYHVMYCTTNGGKDTGPNKYLITKDLVFQTIYQSNIGTIQHFSDVLRIIWLSIFCNSGENIYLYLICEDRKFDLMLDRHAFISVRNYLDFRWTTTASYCDPQKTTW